MKSTIREGEAHSLDTGCVNSQILIGRMRAASVDNIGRLPGPRAKEVTMLAKPFEKPVRVWVGLGFPRQLNSVADAYQMLTSWNGNSPEQKAALRVCKAALAGDVDAETARGVFVAFARKKDILIDDGVMPPPTFKGTDSHV